jgi:type IV secretory pathway VirB10-like protein
MIAMGVIGFIVLVVYMVGTGGQQQSEQAALQEFYTALQPPDPPHGSRSVFQEQSELSNNPNVPDELASFAEPIPEGVQAIPVSRGNTTTRDIDDSRLPFDPRDPAAVEAYMVEQGMQPPAYQSSTSSNRTAPSRTSSPQTDSGRLAAQQSGMGTGLSFNSTYQPTGGVGSSGGYPQSGGGSADVYPAQRPVATPSYAASVVGQDGYAQQNGQQGKQDFFEAATVTEVIRASRFDGPLLNMLAKGSVIQVVMYTGIDSSNPGMITGIVTKNIYDTMTGNYLLIPAGSQLIAEYNSAVTWGQNRVQIAWNHLRRPDGVVVPLGNMPGVDLMGQSGATGRVDNHWDKMAAGLGIMSLFTILTGEIAWQAENVNSPGIANVGNKVNAEVEGFTDQYLTKILDLEPTINIPPGDIQNVLVNTDIVMPIAAQRAVTDPYVRRP